MNSHTTKHLPYQWCRTLIDSWLNRSISCCVLSPAKRTSTKKQSPHRDLSFTIPSHPRRPCLF